MTEATADDWQRVRDLRLAALADAPDAFWSTVEEERDRPEQEWRAWIERERTALLIATARDGVRARDAGIVVVGPHHEDGTAAGLYAVWVAPWARGRGVGGALMRAAVARAEQMGFPRILLDVGDHNAPAIALYERFGFEPTGRTSLFPEPRQHITEHERARELAPASDGGSS